MPDVVQRGGAVGGWRSKDDIVQSRHGLSGGVHQHRSFGYARRGAEKEARGALSFRAASYGSWLAFPDRFGGSYQRGGEGSGLSFQLRRENETLRTCKRNSSADARRKDFPLFLRSGIQIGR